MTTFMAPLLGALIWQELCSVHKEGVQPCSPPLPSAAASAFGSPAPKAEGIEVWAHQQLGSQALTSSVPPWGACQFANVAALADCRDLGMHTQAAEFQACHLSLWPSW